MIAIAMTQITGYEKIKRKTMHKCWNCGNEIETKDKFHYVDVITNYRNSMIASMDVTEEWDQGFLDGLNAAREVLRES